MDPMGKDPGFDQPIFFRMGCHKEFFFNAHWFPTINDTPPISVCQRVFLKELVPVTNSWGGGLSQEA